MSIQEQLESMPLPDCCDSCGKMSSDVGRCERLALDTEGNSVINLCHRCWYQEMAWRRERNRHVLNKFPLLPFPCMGFTYRDGRIIPNR